MPLHFWNDAFLTATFLINRMATLILHNICPNEKLFWRPPDYGILRSLVVHVTPIFVLTIDISSIFVHVPEFLGM